MSRFLALPCAPHAQAQAYPARTISEAHMKTISIPRISPLRTGGPHDPRP
jgi:hypothetical protein